MNETTQKVALVTGAARGIGLATAKRFLADGWRVALLDIDGEAIDRAKASLAGSGETIAICCDVSDAAAVDLALSTVRQHFGRLDGIGQQPRGRRLQTDPRSHL